MVPTQKIISILFLVGFFGFYSIQPLFLLFLIKFKHFLTTDAYHIFGAFIALTNGYVGLTGFCSENYLGPRKTMLLGLWIMFIGYMGLFFFPNNGFFPSLAAICIGMAIFKPNLTIMIGYMYQNNQSKLHSIFTLYYMIINLSILVAATLGPFLSSQFGYKYAFIVNAFFVFINICSVYYYHQILDLKKTTHVLPKIQIPQFIFGLILIVSFWLLTVFLLSSYHWVAASLAGLLFFILTFYLFATFKECGIVRRKMLIALILIVEGLVILSFNQQMFTSINMYAILYIHPHFLSYPIDPQSLQALNPFWIIVFSPILAYLYQRDSESQTPWSIFQKFAMAMFCCGISYFILFLSHYFATKQYYVSQNWLILSYIFQALAELLVGALGLAMIVELVPEYHRGIAIGLWYTMLAISGVLGAQVASAAFVLNSAPHSYVSFMRFAHVFGEIAFVSILLSFVMFMSAPLLRKFSH